LHNDAQPFWDGCARGALLLQRCGACGRLRHPPSPICPHCRSGEHAWEPASGRGTIYTYTVVRQALAKGWDARIPYVVAVVELAEGPRMLSNIVEIAPDDVRIGMPVEVLFVASEGEQQLPLFKPQAH
jgi:uncharacterized OB-fold protein